MRTTTAWFLDDDDDDDELDNLYSSITLESRENYTSRALTTAEKKFKTKVCLELPLK